MGGRRYGTSCLSLCAAYAEAAVDVGGKDVGESEGLAEVFPGPFALGVDVVSRDAQDRTGHPVLSCPVFFPIFRVENLRISQNIHDMTS